MTAAAPRARLARLVAGLACRAAALILAPSPASARTDIAPYLEVQQVLSADLNDSDVLTYTAAVAGIDGRASTRRFKAQISYRYEHRFAWDDDLSDDEIHTGVDQARLEVVQNRLSSDAVALAARPRVDPPRAIFSVHTVATPHLAEDYNPPDGPPV